jgi:amidase
LLSVAELDSEVQAAYEQASALLESLGHELVDIEPPMDEGVVPEFETVWATSAALWPVDPSRERLLRPLTRWFRRRAAETTAVSFALALTAMAQAGARALGALSAYDVVLTPTLARLPAPVGGLRNDDDPAADFEAQKAFTPYTSAWNVTGMPAVSLPTGWSRDGLPIGTMLAGKPGLDHLLYALASQVESAVAADHGWNRPALTL